MAATTTQPPRDRKQPSLSFRSRLLSSLSFLFALVFGLIGVAPLINNALYTRNKIFLSWLLIAFQSDNQWLAPIFWWLLAGGFLVLGIVLCRRTANSRSIQFNQSETTGKTWIQSPTMRILLRIGVLGAYLVFIGYICILAFMSHVFNAAGTAYEDSLSYQGHVYLLSVTPIPFNAQAKQEPAPEANTSLDLFNFEVSQCDASGWFCHVIHDGSHTVELSPDFMTFALADLVDAHLQADVPHRQLFILYHGEGTSDSGKLLCPIPSP